jgi:hypothetical protein
MCNEVAFSFFAIDLIHFTNFLVNPKSTLPDLLNFIYDILENGPLKSTVTENINTGNPFLTSCFYKQPFLIKRDTNITSNGII